MRQSNYALGRNWNRGPERKFEPGQIERLLAQAGFRVKEAFGLQPATLKAASLWDSLCRKMGQHALADRAQGWAAQRFVVRGILLKISSVIAYELE